MWSPIAPIGRTMTSINKATTDTAVSISAAKALMCESTLSFVRSTKKLRDNFAQQFGILTFAQNSSIWEMGSPSYRNALMT